LDRETSIIERLARIEDSVKRLDRQLNGGDGLPGLIEAIRGWRDADRERNDERHQENLKRMIAIEKRQIQITSIAVAVYLVWGSLTGSGFATLEHLLKVLHP
jgi:hypothetical protein